MCVRNLKITRPGYKSTVFAKQKKLSVKARIKGRFTSTLSSCSDEWRNLENAFNPDVDAEGDDNTRASRRLHAR